MKNFTASEWVRVLLALAIAVVVIMAGMAMVIRGSAQPSPELVQIRLAFFDLLKVIVGGLLTSLGMVASKTDK